MVQAEEHLGLAEALDRNKIGDGQSRSIDSIRDWCYNTMDLDSLYHRERNFVHTSNYNVIPHHNDTEKCMPDHHKVMHHMRHKFYSKC